MFVANLDNFLVFRKKQYKVYEKFWDGKLKAEQEGIIPDSFMNKAGYLILIKHPDEIAEPVARFGERIGTEVPAVVYGQPAIHSTFSNYGVIGLAVGSHFTRDAGIESRLLDAVSRASSSHDAKIEMTYPLWMHNQATVIVAGHATPGFLSLAEAIQAEGKREELEKNGKGAALDLPWGAHITSARFLEKKSPKEISDFLRLMKETPRLGISMPKYAEVGYFALTPKGIKYQTIEKFKLLQAA